VLELLARRHDDRRDRVLETLHELEIDERYMHIYLCCVYMCEYDIFLQQCCGLTNLSGFFIHVTSTL
jgi:hypothetical protein